MSGEEKSLIRQRLRELLGKGVLKDIHMETEYVTKGYWVKIGNIPVLLPAQKLADASDEDWRILMMALGG